MLILIDGYNLMHAKGLMPAGRAPRGLHEARSRFLDAVAAQLGPARAAVTTVVFDAADPPKRTPLGRFREMAVVYAVGDENADARLETLIQAHATPKKLTVVSSDRRVLEAARRRKARCLNADQFWSGRLEAGLKPEPPPAAPEPPPGQRDRWLREFAGVEDELRRAEEAPGGGAGILLTQDEVDAIAREISSETKPPPRKR